MLSNLDAVLASYHRCRKSPQFVDTFYTQFLAKSQEVSDKFRETDFAHQKLMLRESLLAMLHFSLGADLAREELQRLGERHSRRGVNIPPPLYDLWLDALCEAVEQHDPEFTTDLKDQWKQAMRPGIELIVSLY